MANAIFNMVTCATIFEYAVFVKTLSTQQEVNIRESYRPRVGILL